MAAQVVPLYGPDNRPLDRSAFPRPQATFGRHVRRRASQYQGTLVSWTVNYISARLAEREKRLAADRAVDLYVNSSMAHGVIEGLLTDVVGTGLTPQPQPMVDWLDLDAEWQEEFTRKAYAWFELVALDPRKWVDATQRQTFYGLEALALFNWKLEGLAAFQVVKKPRAGSPVQTCLLPICPSRIRTPADKSTAEIYDGIEVDQYGAPKRIWVAPTSAADRRTYRADAMQPLDIWDEKTGLPKVLLVTDVRNVAEYRQDSVLTSILKDIRDGEDLREAAQIKALISNLFALFIAEDAPPLGAGENTTVQDWSDRMQELERGLIIQGLPSQKPTEIKTDAPGPNYELMVNDILSKLGMATGRGRENLVREYVSSYSASQASMENESKWSDQDRQVIARDFCQPWWMWMCLEGVLRGKLPVGRVERFRDELYAYTRTDWLRPPVRHIDKFKIAKADEVRLNPEQPTTTLSRIYAEQGADWRTALRQRVREEKYLQELRADLEIEVNPEGEDAS